MFDLIIIGGGPAGYDAAERAGHAGLKVCLFEKNNLGGVCLNEGCIPSKALLNSAKIYEHARDGAKYGVSAENVALDQKAVVARRGKVVRMLVSGVGAKMKGAGVTVVKERRSSRAASRAALPSPPAVRTTKPPSCSSAPVPRRLCRPSPA